MSVVIAYRTASGRRTWTEVQGSKAVVKRVVAALTAAGCTDFRYKVGASVAR